MSLRSCLQSSHPNVRSITRFVYSRMMHTGVAITAPSTEMMITRCAIDSGLSKFAITPGGAGAAPIIVLSELMSETCTVDCLEGESQCEKYERHYKACTYGL